MTTATSMLDEVLHGVILADAKLKNEMIAIHQVDHIGHQMQLVSYAGNPMMESIVCDCGWHVDVSIECNESTYVIRAVQQGGKS